MDRSTTWLVRLAALVFILAGVYLGYNLAWGRYMAQVETQVQQIVSQKDQKIKELEAKVAGLEKAQAPAPTKPKETK